MVKVTDGPGFEFDWSLARLEVVASLAEVARSMHSGDALDVVAILDIVHQLDAVDSACDAARVQLVAEARASGATWGEIGRLLGVSAQGAQQRFGRRAA